ncbi:MAG: M14 family zinc carboxypeptidase [Acidobacteriota bacterium]|nr:M14 family zinc carboxypeptidase [Acidobacteriota bacterium]
MRNSIGLAAAFFGLLQAPWLLAADTAEATRGYKNYAAVEAQLQTYAADHGKIVKLEEIGKSAGGKSIWMMTVTGEGSVPAAERPALFVGANMAGYHNAGTEAALKFADYVLTSDEAAEMRAGRVVYIAPVLNPDAHDRFFANPRRLQGGHATKIDRDLDGFFGEDNHDDLNGDGMITKMRIEDPMGKMIPDEDNPPAMRSADASKGEVGQYKVMDEGDDNDGDGAYNEDAAAGASPDKNFAHAFQYGNRDAGLWAGYLPESKAVMDFLLAKRHIAAAVVFGPANNFLSTPRSVGGGADPGSMKYSVPTEPARELGLDPEQKYTLDEIWERAKTHPQVVQNNLTKDDVAQFLGVGPATKPTNDDMAMIKHFAEKYKKNLEEAGLDKERSGRQYGKGGFTPWLYFQYGAFAVELDVWGIPKPPKKDDEKKEEKLTVDTLEKMTPDQFLALGKEKIAAFLKENKVPEQYNADVVMQAVKGGQMNPKAMAGMLRQMGGGGDAAEDGDKKSGSNDTLLFVNEHAPWAVVQPQEVTLKDGRKAEVFGVDPFIRYNPPYSHLEKCFGAHNKTINQISEALARVELIDVTVEEMSKTIWRVKAVATNSGHMASHTGMAKKARTHLPVRLGLKLSDGLTRLHGPKWVTSDQLNGKSGRMHGEWILQGKKGAAVTVHLFSDQAGNDSRDIKLEAKGGR